MAQKRDRITRRVLWGAALAAICLWYLARELGIEREEMLGFFTASVLLVVGCALAALVLVAVVKAIKLLRR